MRLRRLLVASLAAANFASAAAAASGSSAPTLRLLQTAPIRVFGHGFHSHERVRLLVRETPGGSVSSRVAAGAHGTFTTSLPSVHLGRCTALVVTATGSGGSVAVLRRPQLPACMPS